MRFEDEVYVKLYTRDTPTWVALSWQGRCCLTMILRKLDRAGVLELGKRGTKILPALIGLPQDVVDVGIKDLTEHDVVILRTDGILVMPKFLEGQMARMSDKSRQRLSRERYRDIQAIVVSSTIEKVHDVCHAESQAVTPSHTVSLLEETRLEETRLEEKGKVEEGKASPPSRKSLIPKNWEPKDSAFEWAKKKRVETCDLHSQAENFIIDAGAEARKHVDWDLAFLRWLNNALKWGHVIPMEKEDEGSSFSPRLLADEEIPTQETLNGIMGALSSNPWASKSKIRDER